MAFNFERGLGQAAESVSKTLGVMTVEEQRSALEEKKLRIADELASGREEKGRAFTAGESEKQRGFQSGENAADRSSREKISDAQRQATLAAASISAGASMSNARLAAEVHRESLTPTEARMAEWFAKATPEQKTAFQETLLAKLPPVKPPEGYRKTEDGNLEPIPGGPATKPKDAPSGYRWSADGSKLESVEGGPADPEKVKRANPMNNEQARDAGFADRMLNSAGILRDLDKQGTSPAGRLAEGMGKGGNYLQSESYQQFRQAKEDFINAQLRRESGAAISKDEFEKADRQYFPQPGDGPKVIEQKEKNRQLAVEAMIRGAGPSYKTNPSVDEPPKITSSPPPPPAPVAGPPPVEKRVIGRVYQSPNGPLIYMGDDKWAVQPERK